MEESWGKIQLGDCSCHLEEIHGGQDEDQNGSDGVVWRGTDGLDIRLTGCHDGLGMGGEIKGVEDGGCPGVWLGNLSR